MFDITVWIAEGFLAVFFVMAGLPKVAGRGIERWVGFDQVPRGMTILIGICEECAAIGLVVPILAKRGEWTTPLAAVGIAVISLMATGFHVRNREWLPGLETALWSSLAGSIAIARWDKMSGAPSLSKHDLAPVLVVLIVAIIVNLVVLTRMTPPAKSAGA